MNTAKNLTGMRFGILTVIEPTVVTVGRHQKWLCKCDCGQFHEAVGSDLIRGKIRSCGCMSAKWCSLQHTTHGCLVGTSKSRNYPRLYRIWSDMKSRCGNPRNDMYKHYGGKGISVCPEWATDYATFQSWAMSNGYSDELSIDRIDNSKGYYPENCRWSTVIEQARNKSNCIYEIHDGIKMCLSEIAEIQGVNASTYRARRRNNQNRKEVN